MKIGERVYSTKVRPGDIATVSKTHVDIKDGVTIHGRAKVFRTTYEATYDDGSKLIFYGFDINRFVFRAKDEVDVGQMTLDQFMDMKGGG